VARNYEMTWQSSTRRWFRKHRGKTYTVSCRQLGCRGTKEDSATAANAWWDAKIAEIESAPPTVEDRQANAFRVWAMVQNWQQIDEQDREKLVDSLLGAGQYQAIRSQADAMIATAVTAPPADRTVESQVERWKKMLQGACESGRMSEGRFDAYCRKIRRFTEWIGPQSAIDAIDEIALEGFYNHLMKKVAEKKEKHSYSRAFAHELLMTAQQFIAWLAELKLIPAPGNIRSRRFRFNHSVAAKIETFKVAELQTILKRAGDVSLRTQLCVLLMLNCGMYQNDIAELKAEEVDWKKGRLTRARSKTRERNGPVVTYKLWPETFALLKKLRAPGDLVLTTEKGNPLVRYRLVDGEFSRYDAIQSAWNRLAEQMGGKTRLSMKHLRKTSATLLGEHPQYKFYTTYFLGDSPKHMTDKHYVKPSDAEFFEALGWLRRQIMGPENGKARS
jgi:integrase